MAALLRRNCLPLGKPKGDFSRQRSDGGVYTWCNLAGWKRGRRLLRSRLGVLLVGTGATCGAFLYMLDKSVKAMGPAARLPSYPWDLNGYFTSLDHSAVRRGWQVFRTVCYTCHSLRFVRFIDLINVSHTVDEVKAIAADFEVEDGPDLEGNYYTRPGKLVDLIPLPYPNEEAARAANFGAYPPDLTYIIEAKRNGRNYLFSLLTGWMDPPAGISLTGNQHFNVYFPGNVTGMAQMLVEGIVEYDDGTPSTTSQMAKDLVSFLSWTSSQEFDTRKLFFIKAMGIFIILFVSTLHLKRHVWSHLKTRQIAYVPKDKY